MHSSEFYAIPVLFSMEQKQPVCFLTIVAKQWNVRSHVLSPTCCKPEWNQVLKQTQSRVLVEHHQDGLAHVWWDVSYRVNLYHYLFHKCSFYLKKVYLSSKHKMLLQRFGQC